MQVLYALYNQTSIEDAYLIYENTVKWKYNNADPECPDGVIQYINGEAIPEINEFEPLVNENESDSEEEEEETVEDDQLAEDDEPEIDQ